MLELMVKRFVSFIDFMVVVFVIFIIISDLCFIDLIFLFDILLLWFRVVIFWFGVLVSLVRLDFVFFIIFLCSELKF